MIAIKHRNSIEVESNYRGLIFINEYDTNHVKQSEIIIRSEDVDSLILALLKEKHVLEIMRTTSDIASELNLLSGK